MSTLTTSSVTKIAKLLPRLASDFDGEVLATARAVIRALRAEGNDLHDVVAALKGPVREIVVYRERPAPAQKAKKQKERPPVDWSDEDCLEEVLRYGPHLLENGRLDGMAEQFVSKMLERARVDGRSFRMSVKQLAWFRKMVAQKFGGTEP